MKPYVYIAGAVLTAAVIAVYLGNRGSLNATAAAKPAATANTSTVVATVNGRPIYEFEMTPMLQNGIDRSIALDRRITQSVIASAAEKEYSKDAQIALDAARSDILAQIYAKKKSDAVRAAITDKEIATFYDKNVTAEDARQLKVRNYITADAREAQTLFETISKTPNSKEAKDVIAKMAYLKTDGEHFIGVNEVPYNLGQVVKKMKAGDVMQPVVIREGVLLMYLEEIKEVPRPTLEKVKAEIQNYLVTEKLGQDVQTLRKAAKIELKS